MRSLAILFAGLVVAAGCATRLPVAGALAADTPGACERWFSSLDAVIDRDGVRDAEAARITGFPYLRVDRFLASFANVATQSEAAFATWIAHLRRLDREARAFELQNLAPAALPALQVTNAAAALERGARCAAVLSERDQALPEVRAAIVAGARVPDDYSNTARVLGLYPLSALVFARGVAAWQRETLHAFERGGAAGSADDAAQVFAPPKPPLPAAQARAIFAGATLDALGVPRFSPAERELLFNTYAPTFRLAGAALHDRIGTVHWNTDGSPGIDQSRPAVYRRLAYTRVGDRVLAQFVYTVWFSERPASGAFDILAGALDGLVVRVSVDENGEALLVDSIHPCGCFHMFFPGPRLIPRPPPAEQVEWMFSPASLPPLPLGQRLEFTLAGATHAITRVAIAAAGTGNPDAWLDDNDLRSLGDPQGLHGQRRSLFDADGLVRGTERAERFLFWPMGIANAGAMRQWGRHATAFIGRRHFDDADLIERRFDLIEPAATSPR